MDAGQWTSGDPRPLDGDEPPSQRLEWIAIDQLSAGRHQPRKEFGGAELEALAQSIRTVGIIQPLVVRARGHRFEIIAGERRWRAAQLAGVTHVPAIVRSEAEERTAVMALVENLQRQDLNPMEEAEAYARLQKEFLWTQAELATRVGKKRSTVANVLRLLALPTQIQQAVRSGEVTLGHAKAILALPTKDAQLSALRKIRTESWTVRKVEAWTHKQSRPVLPKGSTEVEEVRRALEYHLNAKVSIADQRIVISFQDAEDCWRIVEAMGLEKEPAD